MFEERRLKRGQRSIEKRSMYGHRHREKDHAILCGTTRRRKALTHTIKRNIDTQAYRTKFSTYKHREFQAHHYVLHVIPEKIKVGCTSWPPHTKHGRTHHHHPNHTLTTQKQHRSDGRHYSSCACFSCATLRLNGNKRRTAQPQTPRPPTLSSVPRASKALLSHFGILPDVRTFRL